MNAFPMVPCTKCLAEVSTDREACPHCGTELPDPPDVVKLRAENARLKQADMEEIARLEKENAALRAKAQKPN